MVTREARPELYALLDKIAAELNGPRIDSIALEESFNAWCGRYGLRRRTVLTIGTELWFALSAEGRLAILGHEVGHLVNGDPGMSLLTQPALTTFRRLAIVFSPRGLVRNRYGALVGTGGILLWLTNLFAYVVLGPVSWVFRRIDHRLWLVARADRQSAEVYADALGVALAGTDGTVEAFRAVLLDDVVRTAMVRGAHRDATPADLRQAARRAVGENLSSMRRREQYSLRMDADVLGSHPPAGLRLRLISGWPPEAANGAVTEDDFDRADAELDAEFRHLLRSLLRERSDRGSAQLGLA
jgi:Zn-dependent protease with chaperone function